MNQPRPPLSHGLAECIQGFRIQRRQLLDTFAKEYEPLTLNCVCPETNNKTESKTKYPGQKHFTWSDGPLPWDNQGGAV